MVKKSDLVNSKTHKPLQLRNTALLSLDGGGLRGILTGVILEEAERVVKDVIQHDNLLPPHHRHLQPDEWGIDLADYFECVAGASAGSMLALYVASKGGAALESVQDWLPRDPWAHHQLHEGSAAVAWRIIRHKADDIFTPPWKQWLRFWSTDWYRALLPFASGVFWAKYSAAGLRETLQLMMGTQLRLSELHTSVVIPSYELETSSPFTFWHKHSSLASDRATGYIAMQRSEEKGVSKNALSMSGGVQLVNGRDFKVWEVACASAAAPTFFPSAEINTTPDQAQETRRTFVDGGLIANNPTIQGLTFMLGELGQDMDNIAVLSIGTGSAVKDLRKGTLKSRGRGWGMLEWILPNQGNIVTTIMDGSSEASQAIVEVFFKDKLGPAQESGKQHSRLLRIQKTVDDAQDAKHMSDKDVPNMRLSDMVKVLSEMDRLDYIDELVEVGQATAKGHRQKMQDFVRYSLFGEVEQDSISTNDAG